MTRSIILLCLQLLIFITSTPLKAANLDKQSDLTSPFLNIQVDSLIMEICRQEGTSHIGGIWRTSVDGGTIGIVPAKAWQRATSATIPGQTITQADQWVMILIDSPSPTLQPGTIMGYFTSAAKPDNYNAVIFTKQHKSQLSSPHRFTLHLSDDGHLTMRAIHKGVQINPWRFLPYMIRGAFKYRNETPQDADGFIKLTPAPRNPQNPRYL
jgi:hypothetical protein